MRIMKMLALAAVVVMAAGLAGCGSDTPDSSAQRGGEGRDGQGQGQGQQRSPEEWLQRTRDNVAEAKVPMETVIPQAAAAAGGKVVGIRLSEGTNGPEYVVEVLGDTAMFSVRIDAVTDSLLAVGPSRRGGNRGGRPDGGQDGGRNRERGNNGNRGGHTD